MIQEFYHNMGIFRGVGDVLYITSVVNSNPILVNHVALGKSLKLTARAMSLSPIDVSKLFVFDKNEMSFSL